MVHARNRSCRYRQSRRLGVYIATGRHCSCRGRSETSAPNSTASRRHARRRYPVPLAGALASPARQPPPRQPYATQYPQTHYNMSSYKFSNFSQVVIIRVICYTNETMITWQILSGIMRTVLNKEDRLNKMTRYSIQDSNK